MSFLLYLLEKEALSQKTIIDLIDQKSRLIPSFLSIVHDKKYLPEDETLKILKIHLDKKIPSLQIIRENNFLDESIIQEILEDQNNIGSPLSSLIMEKGDINPQEYTKEYDSYLKLNSQKELLKNEKFSSTTSSLVNQAALDSLAEYGMASEELIEDLSTKVEVEVKVEEESLSKQFQQELFKAFDKKNMDDFSQELTHLSQKIQNMKENTEAINSKEFDHLFSKIQIIKGKAKLAETKLGVRISDQAELLLEEIDNKNSSLNKKNEHIESIRLLIEGLSTLSKGLIDGQVDDYFKNQSYYKEILLPLLKKEAI